MPFPVAGEIPRDAVAVAAAELMTAALPGRTVLLVAAVGTVAIAVTFLTAQNATAVRTLVFVRVTSLRCLQQVCGQITFSCL